MKAFFTLLMMIGSSGIGSAQISGRTPADTQEAFGNDPVVIRDPKEKNVSDALAVLNTIRIGLKKETNAKSVFTEAEYQTLTGNADNFMLERKYENALLLYREVLKNREDQYAKNRIREAEALLAKQQEEEEQRKQDAILRAKAEFASSKTYGKHLVHFTGALLSDECSSQKGTSKIFDQTDQYSNFLSPGKYTVLLHDLQKSGHHTLDGIAVPANTRLIVYKDQHCRGEVLLDITGPAIVNNVIWSDNELYQDVNTKVFNDALQPYFPQETRSWSKTNMHEWAKGSLEIRVESGE